MKLFTTKEVADMISVHPTTLTCWASSGKIKPYRIGKNYRWSEDHIKQLLNIKNDSSNRKTRDKSEDEVRNRCVIYARVSGNLDNDLENQTKVLKEFAISNGYKIVDVIKDKASSFNFKRKGLLKLVDYVFLERIDFIIIYSKDRLSRIAFDLFLTIFSKFNVEIICVDSSEDIVEDWRIKDLVEELVSFLHYITSKMYGIRSYKKKLRKIKELENELRNDTI